MRQRQPGSVILCGVTGDNGGFVGKGKTRENKGDTEQTKKLPHTELLEKGRIRLIIMMMISCLFRQTKPPPDLKTGALKRREHFSKRSGKTPGIQS
jgi:hypothetical protein